jgi:hypothetical protein
MRYVYVTKRAIGARIEGEPSKSGWKFGGGHLEFAGNGDYNNVNSLFQRRDGLSLIAPSSLRQSSATGCTSLNSICYPPTFLSRIFRRVLAANAISMSIPEPPWKKRSEVACSMCFSTVLLNFFVLRQLVHVHFIPKDVAFSPTPVVSYMTLKSRVTPLENSLPQPLMPSPVGTRRPQ